MSVATLSQVERAAEQNPRGKPGAPLLPVLVLAGSRGPDDPLARHANVAHKCLTPVAGRPMLARVIETLGTVPSLGQVAVSLEPGAEGTVPAILGGLPEPMILTAGATPSTSVADAVERLGLPLLVTTGDHPLLSRETVENFLAAARATGGDVVAGMVARDTVERAWPEAKRTYLRFSDGDFSGANLFYLAGPRASSAVAFWSKVEAWRKKPWRMAAAFGPGLLLAYLTRRLSLSEAMTRISRVLDAEAAVVCLRDPHAAVDVDKPSDLALAEAALAVAGPRTA